MENKNKKLEHCLHETISQKEHQDKKLLSFEIVIGVVVSAIFATSILLASLCQTVNWLQVVLIVLGFIIFVIGMAYCIKIEQTVGYYKCAKCGHRYIPKYGSVLWAFHIGRTRYMRCPQCEKKSWHKKVLRKE